MEYFLDKTKEALGFGQVLNLISPKSIYGKEIKDQIKAFMPGQEETLKKEFSKIGECAGKLRKIDQETKEKIQRLFATIPNIGEELDLAAQGLILTEINLFNVKKFLYLSSSLFHLFDQSKLVPRENYIFLLPPEEVKEEYFTKNQGYQFYLGDYGGEDYFQLQQAIRGLLILLKEAGENGALFLGREIELEEEIKKKKQEMEDLELAIRKRLTNLIRNHITYFEEGLKELGYCDLLLAKALFMVQYNCTIPRIIREKAIELRQGININMKNELKIIKKEFTPISLNFTQKSTVITGANMGGKTVTLKTLGLIAAMAQHGIPVLAEGFSFPLFHFLFCTGAWQEKTGLSSFAGEIESLKGILSRIKDSGLIFLDEPARSTNPEEGLAIVGAFLKKMQQGHSMTITITHFEGLARLAGAEHWQVRGIKDVEKIFQRGDLVKNFDYSLEKVEKNTEVPRDAIKVAELLGLEKEVLMEAKNLFREIREGGSKC